MTTIAEATTAWRYKDAAKEQARRGLISWATYRHYCAEVDRIKRDRLRAAEDRARNESAAKSKWHNEIDGMMRVRYTDLADPKPGSFGAQVTRRSELESRNGEAKTAGSDGKLHPARLVSQQRAQLIKITHGLHHRRGLSVREIAATIKAELGLSRSVGTIYGWLQILCDECAVSADTGQPEHPMCVLSATPLLAVV